MMKNGLIKSAVVGVLLVMTQATTAEDLPKADGTVSATHYPFDAKMAKVKFETATFGLG